VVACWLVGLSLPAAFAYLASTSTYAVPEKVHEKLPYMANTWCGGNTNEWLAARRLAAAASS